MQVHYDYITTLIQKKGAEKFTGACKFGFENGKLVSHGEANKFDTPIDSLSNNKSVVDKTIRKACSQFFNGTVVLVFEYGKIIAYSYSQTMKGDRLRKLIGGF